MPSSTVNDELSGWLESATFDISHEQFEQWRSAIDAMAKEIDSEKCYGVVAAAHGCVSDAVRDWMTESLSASDPSFSGRKDMLLTILASATVIEILETPHPLRVVAALLVESARSTFPTPTVDSVDRVARETARHARDNIRKRNLTLTTVQADLAEALKGGPIQPDSDLPVTATAVVAHEGALKLVAQRLAEVASRMVDVIALQDEELNTLWWSYGGLSNTTGEPWSALGPDARCAVVAAMELDQLITRRPSAGSARALLARALAERSSNQVTFADVAAVLVEFPGTLSGLPDHRLVPLTSAARQISKLGAIDATWKKVVERTMGYDPNTKISSLDAAEQILREFDIRRLS